MGLGYIKIKTVAGFVFSGICLKNVNEYNKIPQPLNLYQQFIYEYIEETDDKHDKIHLVILYHIFIEWFKGKNPGTKIPSDKEFGRNIRKYKKVEASLRIEDKVRRGIRNSKFKNTP